MRLYVCAAVFVFATWRRVPEEAIGPAPGVRDETALSPLDTCIDSAPPVASVRTAVEWGWQCVCVRAGLPTCATDLRHALPAVLTRWMDEAAVGRVHGAFSSFRCRLLSFSPPFAAH